jgi:hypothetical protein
MWIITVWQHISPELTLKGFKICCISNGTDETDVDIFCKGSAEDWNAKN